MENYRRLSDKIILAHEQACQEGKPEVASFLLQDLEFDLSAIGGINDEHREETEMLEAAFERHEKLMANR